MSLPGIASDAPAVAARVAVRAARPTLFGLLALGLVASVTLAVTIGPSGLGPADVWAVVLHRAGLSEGHGLTTMEEAIVWQLRLPRVLLAAIVGGGLAVVGATMQAVTRNPLADPYLLGVSTGASVGAVAVIVLGLGATTLGLTGAAFLGALAAFALVVLLAVTDRRLPPSRTILAGVAVAAICDALTSVLVTSNADSHAAAEVLRWMLGSLSGARWGSLTVAAPALLVIGLVFLAHGRALNALAFGDDDAAALGVATERTRWILLVAGALLTAALVAVSGAIGFVGLLLPHAMRFLVGRDHRRLLPATALGGAIFLVWADTAARTAFDPSELPVGAVTALLGGPAFVVLLRRSSGWA
ncbi:FecCD family ABC transporter permease [Patulibacter sp. S7RM1-6]